MNVEESQEDQVRQLEERLLRPEVRRSKVELAQLLADDFREFGSSGRVFDKQQIVDLLQDQPSYQLSLHDFRAVTLGSDLVLATYRATCRAPDSNRTSHSLRSSIWRKRGGRWQVVFHQGTPSAE